MSGARAGETMRVEVVDFTAAARSASGSVPVAALARAAELVLSRDAEVAWWLDGRERPTVYGEPERYVTLRLAARLTVPCVRCLGAVAVDVDETREFRLVADEPTAAAIDAPDLAYDVVSCGARLDLLDLVEDELIMAIPPLPRHEGDCALAGDDAPPAAITTAVREHPFAGLAALRGDRRSR